MRRLHVTPISKINSQPIQLQLLRNKNAQHNIQMVPTSLISFGIDIKEYRFVILGHLSGRFGPQTWICILAKFRIHEKWLNRWPTHRPKRWTATADSTQHTADNKICSSASLSGAKGFNEAYWFQWALVIKIGDEYREEVQKRKFQQTIFYKY